MIIASTWATCTWWPPLSLLSSVLSFLELFVFLDEIDLQRIAERYGPEMHLLVGYCSLSLRPSQTRAMVRVAKPITSSGL